jgi:hypothetical protein
MNLSKNFTLEEITFSPEAIRNGINNKPTEEHIENLKQLCENVLQPLYDALGGPIKILSGYKTYQLNAISNGVKDAQQQTGEAVDILSDGKNAEILQYIYENLPFDQLIWEFGSDSEPNWVHVSYSGENRKLCFKSSLIGGKIQHERFFPEVKAVEAPEEPIAPKEPTKANGGAKKKV